MRYVLNAAMSKEIDRFTIEEAGVLSAALIERAALAVADKVRELAGQYGKKVRVCAVCGCGNNGADGIAAARILAWQGYDVGIIIAGEECRASEEFLLQKKIAAGTHVFFDDVTETASYNIIIDAVLGTGLSGKVTGKYKEAIEAINSSGAEVVSVDIPSGTDSTTGEISGVAVRADETITFGYNKQGIMVYPGKELSGKVTVADIGFCPEAVKHISPAFYYTKDDLSIIPVRKQNSNKGTYGRTLVIAGSREMSGAAYLSAAASYRSGCGLVEIFTDEENCHVIRTLLPEAIVTGYTEKNAETLLDISLTRADCVIIGPGLSQSPLAAKTVRYVMKNAKVPVIADADALNIMSGDMNIIKNHRQEVIITPHIGEMCRLTGLQKETLLRDRFSIASGFASEYNVTCVLKDAATIVAGADGRMYINDSGCAAMSKGGMGDVLTGVTAGMFAVGLSPFEAATMAVYIHGLAGEMAAEGKNSNSVIAGDVLEKLQYII